MTTHAPKTLLLALVLAPLSLSLGCDQPVGDDLDALERDAELAELAELEAADELLAPGVGDLQLEDIVDEDGRPLTTEILVVASSPEQQVGDELTAEDGDAPTLEALGHAIGIGPEDVPVHADELVSQNDTAALALDYEGSFSFGGDMFGKSFDIIRGHSTCGAGKTRAFATAYVEGNGSCYVVGWYTYAPNDCRVRVRINQPGWFGGGVCKMFVYDQ